MVVQDSEPGHTLQRKKVEVKRAEPKAGANTSKAPYRHNSHGNVYGAPPAGAQNSSFAFSGGADAQAQPGYNPYKRSARAKNGYGQQQQSSAAAAAAAAAADFQYAYLPQTFAQPGYGGYVDMNQVSAIHGDSR